MDYNSMNKKGNHEPMLLQIQKLQSLVRNRIMYIVSKHLPTKHFLITKKEMTDTPFLK